MEKLDATKALVATIKPTTDESLRIHGQASRIERDIGAKRYVTPVEHVPMAAIPL